MLTLACATGIVFAVAGCSIAMAARQPSAKNLDVLKPGTARTAVVAELGWPEHTETAADGKRTDLFSVTQGYSKAARVSRVLLHGTADALTLGLWEAIGTPTEMIFDGKPLSIAVTYDATDNVAVSQVIKRQ
jgi:hypothetical protein